LSRPKKCRKVCCLPEYVRFGPLNTLPCKEKYLVMSIDEYEVIRLIDLEGLKQEECACQMQVARTTIQAIYYEARKKIAEALVNQMELRIEGGDFKLCDGQKNTCYRTTCLHEQN